MSSSVGGQTVTIDRGYFDTLIRRAQLNADDNLTNPVVPTSRSEYDGLKKIAAKYANLRRNLLRGGVGEETIDLLSQDDATHTQQKATPAPAPVSDSTSAFPDNIPSPEVQRQPPRVAFDGNGYGSYNAQPKTFGHVHTHDAADWVDVDLGVDDESISGGGGPVGNYHNPLYNEKASIRPQYERQCARSILLTNLAEGVTHADITEVVRGGQLLDIHLRPHDRSAAVSFLRAADARVFFEHVRRHDMYINNKRVEIRWNDRQFILPGHVASKIGLGATRNLVIRRCDPRLTKEVVRGDLEHIHNLVVVKVEFIGGSCYIKTNSVHNAMFARTCMMSRARYKGSKIDWDVDECCQPFDQAPPMKPRKENHTAKKTNGNTMANRFHLLNLDDGGEEDEMDEISPVVGTKMTMGIAA